ncbi:DUF3016 domain-containing protein [Pseudoalteromonas luteoviolacea]|uniref:DUF3016 domain-containing protein n=1 Tax=Pseudoalteromonas luteoviolacea DSM 6061 TaxID=1365250 RepID=A0A167DEZ8_9GAMM|nr:DUF3016 domain-containing protein [Pseudoalteromonas luteoviolacea]KZN48754.1 hypothetical protein N475_00065 [Pseudoalteromonas luteoviolacea DSM 6061]MBE0387552.1 hypothetical protein [Pseudoalteromonas luteoviolacea DSM 6061]TQF72347.1 DUF3016 domain-containing protein [Pseudoalteromonas luteoviolacea]
MKYIKYVIAAMFLPMTASAGEVNVTWLDFKEYRDVFPANETRGGYHKRIAKKFEQHLNKLAADLPAGYTMSVTFEDVDLAGDVRFNMNDIRIIKPIYFPRLKMSYSVTDNTGKVVTEAKSKVLKDLGFMDKLKIGRDSEFYYDKRLLSDWYKDEIAPKI